MIKYKAGSEAEAFGEVTVIQQYEWSKGLKQVNISKQSMPDGEKSKCKNLKPQQAGQWVWSGMSKGLWEEMCLESSARAMSYMTYTVGINSLAFEVRPEVMLAQLFSGTTNML